MAHKMGAGSTKNTRDSHSKRLGIKCTHSEYVTSGSILIRQRGTKFKPGQYVGCGKDHTLFALSSGFIVYTLNKRINIIPHNLNN